MDGHNALPFEKAIKPGYGAGVATLCKLNPEDDETGIGVTPAHVGDKLDLVSRASAYELVHTPGFPASHRGRLTKVSKIAFLNG